MFGFTGRKTIDEVLSTVTQAVTDLRLIAEASSVDADNFRAEAERAELRAQAAALTVDRAVRVADRLEALVK